MWRIRVYVCCSPLLGSACQSWWVIMCDITFLVAERASLPFYCESESVCDVTHRSRNFEVAWFIILHWEPNVTYCNVRVIMNNWHTFSPSQLCASSPLRNTTSLPLCRVWFSLNSLNFHHLCYVMRALPIASISRILLVRKSCCLLSTRRISCVGSFCKMSWECC